MINYTIHKSHNQDFAVAISELVEAIEAKNIIRLVFFIEATTNNEEYTAKKRICKELLEAKYPVEVSLSSVIAQKPLDCNVVLEVQSMSDGWDISYKKHYVVAENKELKCVFSSDLVGDIATSAYEQSQTAFEHLTQILDTEGLGYNNIVRQWNYIEKILYCNGGHQNYQDFNDVRSDYYNPVDWVDGYPAATGIGMQQGGVILSFDAVKIKEGNFAVRAIDNTLQRAAHVYSKEVLIGDETIKSTPKFERAKAVFNEKNIVIYISGTAAIRGEESVDIDNIARQTQVTMENIEHLISEPTLSEFGVSHNMEGTRLRALRVYIKNEADTAAAKEYMDTHYPTIPTFYLWGNVCREELLIEIEGILM